ncbi:MAG: hypothetical protein ACK5O9_06250 [Holosporales bacterium]|jgi:hypothetical protein
MMAPGVRVSFLFLQVGLLESSARAAVTGTMNNKAININRPSSA